MDNGEQLKQHFFLASAHFSLNNFFKQLFFLILSEVIRVLFYKRRISLIKRMGICAFFGVGGLIGLIGLAKK